MSAEWVAAGSAAGTFLVIAASAVAALVQLRHLRISNQIAALNDVNQVLQSPNFSEIMQFLRGEIEARLNDADVRRAFLGAWFHDVPEEYRRLSVVANYFELLGVLVKNGIIDKSIACELWSSVIADSWDAFGPIAAQRRVIIELRQLWENFEYLAILSQDWIARHPKGNYPRRMRRSSFPIWAETLER